MDAWIRKLNGFSQRAAKEYLEIESGKKKVCYDGLAPVSRFRRWVKFELFYKIPVKWRAHLYYIYYYYINLGFLDGTRGKLFQWMYIYWYKFLTDAYIMEKQLFNTGSK